MSKLALEYLRHILEEIEFILSEVNKISEEEFYRSPILKRAFVWSLEVIGEATKNIPQDFREKYKEINWKDMARMRDKLIHHYFGIDYSIVWDVIKNEIPGLHSKIVKVIKSEEES